MKKGFLKLLTASVLLLLLSSGCDLGSVAAGSFGADDTTRQLGGTTKDGSYAPFAEIGYAKEWRRTKMQIAWDCFHDTVYHTVPGDSSMAYILDNYNHEIRSEGMTYGMMLCVQLGKHKTFDKLLKFVKKKMLNPINTKYTGFLRYRLDENFNSEGGESWDAPASDGDIYYAMALLLAQNRWGGTYQLDAYASMEHMLDTNQYDKNEICFFTDGNLVKHWPVNKGTTTAINPSYCLPAFFKFFAEHPIYRQGNRNRYGQKERWKEIAKASRSLLIKTLKKSSYRLPPGICKTDGTPMGWDANVGKWFGNDAWRVAMNIALDTDWNGSGNYGSNSTAGKKFIQDYAYKFCSFFESKNSNGKRDYKDRWNIDGTLYTPNDGHSAGLVAMNAMVACLMKDTSSNNAMRDRYLKELWYLVPQEITNYYNICLYTLAMAWACGYYNLY